MKYQTISISLFFGSVLALCMGACNAANSSSSTGADSSNQEDYVKTSKPGAAVQFQNISNDVTSAAARTVSVKLSEGYQSGILTVHVAGSENLSVLDATDSFVFNMSGDQTNQISVTVKPLSDGRHFVNFTAVAEYGDNQVARSYYSVPVYANVTAKTYKENSEAEDQKTEGGVVVLEAEETIQ